MILVTGGAGYIGSNVVLALINRGFKVIIFDNLENGHMETIDTLKGINQKAVNFIFGDLKNSDDVAQVFKKYKIDAVMHFASYINAEESVENPSKYYNNNLIGSLNLITHMIVNHVNKMVFSSTAAIYGEQNCSPISEECLKNPINPYGHSKLMIEQILNWYDVAYGLKSVNLRYFNVIGADSETRIGEWHEPETHLIPNIFASARKDRETFQLYGDSYNTKDGTCVRDFIDVEDLAEAHILALRYLVDANTSDCFNLGTTIGYTVKDVLSVCEKTIDKKITIKVNKCRAGDPEILVADARKAKNVLNWSPKRTLEESIINAYKWYLRLETIKICQSSRWLK